MFTTGPIRLGQGQVHLLQWKADHSQTKLQRWQVLLDLWHLFLALNMHDNKLGLQKEVFSEWKNTNSFHELYTTYCTGWRKKFKEMHQYILQSTGSRARGLRVCSSQALEHRFSSCSAQASWIHGMWDLPGPGFKPVSTVLACRSFTTEPTGKSSACSL